MFAHVAINMPIYPVYHQQITDAFNDCAMPCALQPGNLAEKNFGIFHDDVIKWKPFPRYWPFVRGIHRSPMNSPQKGQWRGALMFSLMCVWINGWVNNDNVGDLRRYRVHCDVTVMKTNFCDWFPLTINILNPHMNAIWITSFDYLCLYIHGIEQSEFRSW